MSERPTPRCAGVERDCDSHGYVPITFAESLEREAGELREALQGLMTAMDQSDKQWIGLNMLKPSQKLAYEILQAGRIQAAAALRNTEPTKS